MSMEFIYPAELPVSGARERIMQAVRSSQVVIVSGQTGSGKTTQIPKMLLELGRGTHGRQIILTQPQPCGTDSHRTHHQMKCILPWAMR